MELVFGTQLSGRNCSVVMKCSAIQGSNKNSISMLHSSHLTGSEVTVITYSVLLSRAVFHSWKASEQGYFSKVSFLFQCTRAGCSYNML